ncbi:C-type lectin domain family 10 member A-like [Hippoglossus stenolepis]|uniref:C-type lectin domain family 10 member A-like n=1 Tax=Hippoglossus stenolepis TaxID=195615 RepID=UPI001FAFAC31|nr:C-type lectin domain family 10 member A-like [Hippoglossus stenolepis]
MIHLKETETMTCHLRMKEEEESVHWIKEPQPVSVSGVSRFRRWMVPALTVTVILVLIITLGATNVNTSNRLWSVEKRVSNLSNVIESLSASLQNAQETAKEVQLLHSTVEDQLTSVSEALKQLSVIDSLSRSLTSIKCSLGQIINNGSGLDGCCPLDWKLSGFSCYFFSRSRLSWNESRVWCEEHESHLVILSSDRDWDFVNRNAVPATFWVGLSDWRTGTWEWVDQTPYSMERRRWGPGQPDNWTNHGLGPGEEDCAQLYIDGRLNDLHCSHQMRYICQKLIGDP